MAVDTKSNLNSCKFEQCIDDELTLSGCTDVHGVFELSSGATLSILSNRGTGKVLTSDANGVASWQTLNTNANITGATNGLTKTNQQIKLGGILTGDTVIDVDDNSLLICSSTYPNRSILYNQTGDALNLSWADTGNTCISCMNLNSDCILLQSKYAGGGCYAGIKLAHTDNRICFDSANVYRTYHNSCGLTYTADYSSNANARWIPDAGYVTGKTSQSLLSANNGLTKVGTNVVLGGALTGNTIVKLNTYNLTLSGNTSNDNTLKLINHNDSGSTEFIIQGVYGEGGVINAIIAEPGDTKSSYPTGYSDVGQTYINSKYTPTNTYPNCISRYELFIIYGLGTMRTEIYDGVGYNGALLATKDITVLDNNGSNKWFCFASAVCISSNQCITFKTTKVGGGTFGVGVSTGTYTCSTIYDGVVGSNNADFTIYGTIPTGNTSAEGSFSIKRFGSDDITVDQQYRSNSRIATDNELFIGGGKGIKLQVNGIIASGMTNVFEICSNGLLRSCNSGYTALITNCNDIANAGYVTGKTSISGIQTANNGLTKVGTNIVLGGALTGNTVISTVGNDFIVADDAYNHVLSVCTGSTNGIQLIHYGAGIQLSGTSTTEKIFLGTDDTYICLSTGNASELSFAQPFQITDNRATKNGLTYAADYSANYTARSIPDVGFVTGFTISENVSVVPVSPFTSINMQGLSDEYAAAFALRAKCCSYTISGNSSSTGFTINHALSKQFVNVQIVQAASPYATVYTNTYRTNTNCVCLTFDTAPPTGTNYCVIITG